MDISGAICDNNERNNPSNNDQHLQINNLFDYMANTTIHGIKYLGEARRPTSEKIFWMITFIVCVIFMGFFISQVVIKWRTQSIILVEDEVATLIFNIPFPAVTICPQVKLKTEYFRYEPFGKVMKNIVLPDDFDSDPEYLQKLELAQLVCHPETTHNFQNAFEKYKRKTINASYIELLHKVSPTKSELFESVQYPMDCESSFVGNVPEKQKTNISPILTNEGVCFTFNVPSEIIRTADVQTNYLYYNISQHIQNWNYETGYSGLPAFPITTCAAGYISSLRLQVKSATADLNTLCQPTNIGYKVILHSPTAYPNTFGDFIPVRHETLTRIGVIPRITTTSKTLRSYDPKQRQCYFNDERKLNYYRFYNRNNCRLECFANFTIKEYGCIHFALPTKSDIPICSAIWQNIQHMFELGDNLRSIIDYSKYFPGLAEWYVDQQIFTCDCLPECNSIQYDYTVDSEAYEYDKLREEVYAIFKENSTQLSKPTKIIVYLKDYSYVGKTRKQFYTFSDLVSNFGGLLGLFMGGSILSIVEIIYYCVIRKYGAIRNRNCVVE